MRSTATRVLACLSIWVAGAAAPAAAQTVASLSLTPSTIAGGSGGFSAGTVTLSGPAPAGGVDVQLASSNPELAASVRSVHIPAGAETATFQIATNKLYRRYSGLPFEAVISASLAGSSQAAVLTVTAQLQPPDVPSDSSQREGLMCGGGFPASRGERGILYDCALAPNFGTVGECTFHQECLALGCQTVPADGFVFSHVCAETGVYPIAVTPQVVVGGDTATATAHLNGAAGPGGNDALIFSDSPVAQVPVFNHVPEGETTATATVTTSAVTRPQFAAISVNAELDQPQRDGSTFVSRRSGLVWLTVLPSPGACAPATCEEQGWNCGIQADGCGGTLECGACEAPATCGGQGVPNVCGVPPTLTLTVTGRGGASVVSIPEGLNVAVGETESASFPRGTTITLQVVGGRSATWSGVCSSGKKKTPSCTFVLQEDSTETATVR